MSITDCFKLSKIIYENNKFRTFISIAIVTILSFVYMFILFIGFSYYNNSKIIEDNYLKSNPVSLSLVMKKDIDFNNVICDARKTEPSIILSETAYISLVDFDSLCYDDLKIIAGEIPTFGNYEIIVSETSENDINDIVIINEIECLVVGIYESNYFDCPIGDIITFSNDINFSSISFIYSCNNIKKNLEKISNFSRKVQELGHEEFTSKVLEQVKKYRGNSNLILIICIIIVVLLFTCTIGFYLNSISMCFDQTKRIFTLLSIIGGSNKDSIIIIFIYTLLVSVLGIISSGILMLVSAKIINVGDLFVSVIPSYMMDVIPKNFNYNNSFPWIIPIIISFLLIFAIYIHCYKLISKEYKKQYDIIKIKDI